MHFSSTREIRFVIRAFGQTEIRYVDVVVPIHQDILRLQIAMKHIRVVSGGKSPNDLPAEVNRPFHGKRCIMHYGAKISPVMYGIVMNLTPSASPMS